ncbi:hypothetical protein [Microbacterium sp.]|uniref:hypothetical protein n=1 Tax=Microbacterium sp. TaxID=51671 RepID=UPI0039E3F54C
MLLGVIIIVMAGVAVAGIRFDMGYPVATVLGVVLVVFTARAFRGSGESDVAREWWRMTASPKSAYVLAALFLLHAAGTAIELLAGHAPPVVWLGVAIGAAISAAYVNSAIHQSRRA